MDHEKGCYSEPSMLFLLMKSYKNKTHMKYFPFWILIFCYCLTSCDSTSEAELNTIRTQVLEHYKGCRAIDYLKDYSEQFVNEFYEAQTKAYSQAFDEMEALAYEMFYGIRPSLMKSKVQTVETYWDANLDNSDSHTMDYIKQHYQEAQFALNYFFAHNRDSIYDPRKDEFLYLTSAWSTLPLSDRCGNKVVAELNGYNYAQFVEFGLSNSFSALYEDPHPQASLNYIFLLLYKAVVDKTADLALVYIVPVELPEGSYEVERDDIINSTYAVGFSDRTAITCTITTNLSNGKAKYEFVPADYNSILVGEGIED